MVAAPLYPGAVMDLVVRHRISIAYICRYNMDLLCAFCTLLYVLTQLSLLCIRFVAHDLRLRSDVGLITARLTITLEHYHTAPYLCARSRATTAVNQD